MGWQVVSKDGKRKKGRFPPWIRTEIKAGSNRKFVTDLVGDLGLHTVCESAKCPNLGDCWHCRTATVMILGDRCTRACRFCAVPTGGMLLPDPDEPDNVANAAKKMNLRFVVLTSVDRDDLEDKGAGHWRATIDTLHQELPNAGVEALTPDFQGKRELIELVVAGKPTVFNHNLETCERLTKSIRSANRYDRSLDVLRIAKDAGGDNVATKSGIMVGLGETDDEVLQTLRDLRSVGVEILTIGQYLQPSRDQWPVKRYVEPKRFEEWAAFALEIGFRAVSSAPMVRSSYRAEELAREALGFTGVSWSTLRG